MKSNTMLTAPGLALGVALLSGPVAMAQPALPPDALQHFQTVVGNRIEAVSIFGGDYATAGGVYTFRGGNP
jgi:hypothetical protein